MNKGILKATGEYLLFLNSGDELNNADVIENISSYSNDTDLFTGKVNMVYNKGKMNIHTDFTPPIFKLLSVFYSTSGHFY